MFDTLIDIVFFNLYGSAITVLTLLAAIPYGIWQGLKKLKDRVGGARRGNSRTGGRTQAEDDRGTRGAP